MSSRIAVKDLIGFKLWLDKIGYYRKDLPDGGSSFKNNRAEPRYVLVSGELTLSRGGKQLYKEYKQHLSASDEE